MGRGPRSRRGAKRQQDRNRAYLERKLDWVIMWRNVFFDRERKEIISMISGPAIDIERGEVLYGPNYVSPTLDRDGVVRLNLLRRQMFQSPLEEE